KVSYKTAWYLCHRIREAMHELHKLPLAGVVEVDETYVGGKRRDVGRGNYRDHETAVLGAVQRGGGVRFKVIGRVEKERVKAFIRQNTQPTASAIYTDEAPLYKGDTIPAGTPHESVNHSDHEYVRADVHTNTVESVWSLFKRSIIGAHHQISTK